jgi:hypothetical protein
MNKASWNLMDARYVCCKMMMNKSGSGPGGIQRSCNLQPELDLGGPKFYTLGSGYIM